jgi:hypothetical protein
MQVESIDLEMHSRGPLGFFWFYGKFVERHYELFAFSSMVTAFTAISNGRSYLFQRNLRSPAHS